MINEFEIDWRQRVREDRINAIQNPEIASDQVEEISYDDGSNDENDELEQEIMGFKELITMEAMPCLGWWQPRYVAYDHENTKRIGDLQLKNRKQSSIKAYFNKSL